MIDSDLLHEFLENSQQIRDLVDRNLEIIRKVDRAEYERAKAYWYAHIVTSLSNDHDYLGNSMSTMQDSATLIESRVYDDKEPSDAE